MDQMQKQLKHFFFDLDGTITESRTEISDSMRDALLGLTKKGADVIIVSGAQYSQMQKQLCSAIEEVATMAQNGNHAMSASGELIWEQKFNWIQKMYVLILCDNFQRSIMFDDILDLVEDRGSQISFSFVGHNAPLEKKKAFDPTRAKRNKAISAVKYQDYFSDIKDSGVSWAIGGTTCIDFYLLGKGANIDNFIEFNEWNKDECIYVGDALTDGGNDASVVGVIETRSIKDPAECESVIKQFTKDFMIDEPEEDEDDDDELLGDIVD
jgi:HAD superfamily hydrolase (TIGR01484 family)